MNVGWKKQTKINKVSYHSQWGVWSSSHLMLIQILLHCVERPQWNQSIFMLKSLCCCMWPEAKRVDQKTRLRKWMCEVCQEDGTRQSLYTAEELSKKKYQNQRKYNMRSQVKTNHNVKSYWLWNNKRVTCYHLKLILKRICKHLSLFCLTTRMLNDHY